VDIIEVDSFYLFKLAAQGYCCSQILLILGLESQGKENPDLVRAMEGLCGGLGRTGQTCGALTGGVCLLGLYAGRGSVEEPRDGQLNSMVNDLVMWFEEEFNSLDCAGILDDSLDSGTDYPVKCGKIVMGVYQKVQEILDAYNSN
jgi:C_GCAxxG_C_C family probable redox protein